MVAITVEPILDAPCPRAGVTVTGLSAGDQVATVWRTSDGQREAVRGARAIPVVDSFYVEDYEAPLGRLVTYELEVASGFDAGVQGVAADIVVDSDSGFIQDPADPASAVPVSPNKAAGMVLMPGTFAQLSYTAEVSTFQVMGSRNPVAIGGARQAAQGASLSILTAGVEENNRLRGLVAGTSVLVIRGLPSWGSRFPGTASYAAATVTESDPLPGDTGTVWEITGDVVRSSSARVLVALWTYQDVADIFATYDQKQAAAGGGTYLDDQKNPANV